MNHTALTAKYRPQTFAQVAGQETLKAILSRASLERRVAPAYLFSGTRGVGKTTLARVFAKALNCRTAPTAEPCNQCDQCRAITAGSAVDVVEIDGASNRGIDDVRRLKEVVGYAPMEGAYKIFIIDEAHMLSREAFNALLKTLEEPPSRVTFIMATTEPHKFPATIISRCQHYVFKRLPESDLVAHLIAVLDKEKVAYAETAVRLIARRGAGSVRDSMSLLSQVLALKAGTLTEESVRSVLGLAGQEAFLHMLEAFHKGDGLTLSRLLRELLDQGLDMGFFLRELSSLWRNLFLLRQSGEAALSVVDLPENEARVYLDAAADFSLQHIHACWQMTLEGQRRVLTSLEPALALELLLLNLALLPHLLSLEQLSSLGRQGGRQGEGPGRNPGESPGKGRGVPFSGTGSACAGKVFTEREQQVAHSGFPGQSPQPGTAVPAAVVASLSPESRADQAQADKPVEETEQAGAESARDATVLPSAEGALATTAVLAAEDEQKTTASLCARNGLDAAVLPSAGYAPTTAASPSARDGQEQSFGSLPAWESIFPLCAEHEDKRWLAPLLRRVEVLVEGDHLTFLGSDDIVAARLNDEQVRQDLHAVLRRWCGRVPEYAIVTQSKPRKSREEIKVEVLSHPLVKKMEAQLGAYVIDFAQTRS